jgi:DNA-binding transcriptional MerR regulator/effector-binding domain-containing protein
MFRIGEFSKIAQVSGRLLRYYEEIGLFSPIYTDKATGFRYYSAEQMPELNRILALKDLGLSLDQIRRMLNDQISIDEMQGMLLLKKAEIERHLQAELKRIRSIESRLQSIRNAEAHRPINVVIKRIPAQPVLSVRSIVESFETALELFEQIRGVLPDKNGYGLCFCMCHSETLVDRDMDLEMGRLVESGAHPTVTLNETLQLHVRELPAAETMATIVVKGTLETLHTGYTEIGLWAEANGYQFKGHPREITLQFPQHHDGSDLITEIQLPVEQGPKRAR